MEKLKMHSPNFVEQNVEKLAELFPNCVTESKDKKGNLKRAIDFDLLKQELSEHIVEGPQERYQLNWPGKREALLSANAPIGKTLRPCREESVNFDTTKNLFIEGDNLDALKLLQETYLSSVKLAYLDPPYNRKKGNDLIYRDNFVGNTYEYLIVSNQLDSSGNKLVANTESNGRFHSDWLSMMYQRLKLVKNILSDDGVVLISIDDNEVANLRRLCDEIYGEENFVGTLIWKNATDNNPTNVAVEHESIHIYAKNKEFLEGVWKTNISDIKDRLIKVGENFSSKYQDIESLQNAYSQWFKENKNQLGPLDRYKYIDFDGIYTGSQSVHNPGKEGYRYSVIHPDTKKSCIEPLMGYRFPKETMDRLLAEKRILFGKDHNKIIELKVYAKDYTDKLASVFELDGRTGPYDLKKIFPDATKVFSNPKPVALMKRLISFIIQGDQICVDLFSGSGTLPHALIDLNSEDGGNRRFIALQYPEGLAEDTKDSRLAMSFCKDNDIVPCISEITKERLRRAGKAVDVEGVDVGFRVLKIDTSNMNDVFYSPDSYSQNDLFNHVDNVKDDRTAEDLLFQVMLDWGIDLSLPVRLEVISKKPVFFVDRNALIACFDKEGGINEEFVKSLCQYEPLRIVFRDSGFSDDETKINVEQIFKQFSPHTDVKSI